MRQQSVPTEADTETADYPVADHKCSKILPAKREENPDGDDMKHRYHDGVSPVDRLADPLER